MISKISEVRGIVKKGIESPKSVFSEIKTMAKSYDWKVREVAAIALVEISKRRKEEVLEELMRWARDGDSNIRRASIEGLKEMAKKEPERVLPVLEILKKDSSPYVKKSVVKVLKNVSRKDPEFLLNLCRKWARLKNQNTNWIIENSLKSLKKSYPKEVEKILKSLEIKEGGVKIL